MKKPLLIAVLALLVQGAAYAADRPNLCGDIKNAYGPYDYRRSSTEYTNQIYLVESAHFTPDVAAGLKGSTGSLGQDLDYTLRAFPNHARALAVMARVALKDKRVMLPGAHYPVECYFDRAIRFAPDDGTVRATYAGYLFARGQYDVALTMFKEAYSLEPENATINYNLALSHLKLKQYTEANLYAQRAYALGFPLPGLKNLLVQAGKWDDTVESGVTPKPPEPKEEATPAVDAATPATPPAAPPATK